AVNRSFFGYLMRKSTVVAAVSEGLAEKYGKIYGRKVELVKNGVDCPHFAPPDGKRKAPAELDGIPRPLLVYAGSINAWVDLNLLAELADLRPRCSLVLIGHHYPGTVDEGQLTRLLSRPNVHWLSSRPYEALPAYLHEAAALLLPRTAAEHSLHSDPLKLYEYLATGKPVVSTALPAVEEFRAHVYVGETPQEFAWCVDEALTGHGEEKSRRQIEAVARHSWAARAGEILRLIS
ncbi:MAG: glycosyltransferase, partial [Desulfotomaculales bacterium]